MNERVEKLYVLYFLVLGLVTLGFGIADFIVTASGSEYTSALLMIGFGTLKLTHLEGKRQPKNDPPDRDLW